MGKLNYSLKRKNSKIIILCFLLVGCSPIPIHYACETPKFALIAKSTDTSYFDSRGYFEKFCPEGVPEKFSYTVNEDTNVVIRVRGEWIDLKPIKRGVPFKLQGKGIRVLDFEGYTQSVRVDSLIDHTLTLSTRDQELVELRFGLVECTCVTYDAI